ncbi:hypothetical protein [Yoonia sp.]|uniref:hypothetical protein n=1 Tax=Yoonia sp. TaxID=2212373 RepID=UPI002DF9608C|nr:hypothetical protein [Yoonia sp.]
MTRAVPFRHMAVVWAQSGLAAFVMIGGGAAHFAMPEGFAPLVPAFLPAVTVILLAGVVQVVIGLAVLWPRTRALGGLAFAALCAAYLPLHLWDYVRPDPVFEPPVAATIRVVIQGLFIWAGLSLWRRAR